MPTYEYRCGSCGATFESRRTVAEADTSVACPNGHENAVRRPSMFAVTSTTTMNLRSRPAGTGCGPGCACVGKSGEGQMA
jgi:putative FmdB family regulatory protein